MNEIFASPYFGVSLSVIAFGIGVKLNQKFKTPFCNPLIIAIVLVSIESSFFLILFFWQIFRPYVAVSSMSLTAVAVMMLFTLRRKEDYGK